MASLPLPWPTANLFLNILMIWDNASKQTVASISLNSTATRSLAASGVTRGSRTAHSWNIQAVKEIGSVTTESWADPIHSCSHLKHESLKSTSNCSDSSDWNSLSRPWLSLPLVSVLACWFSLSLFGACARGGTNGHWISMKSLERKASLNNPTPPPTSSFFSPACTVGKIVLKHFE